MVANFVELAARLANLTNCVLAHGRKLGVYLDNSVLNVRGLLLP
jgi:hypothetical protein